MGKRLLSGFAVLATILLAYSYLGAYMRPADSIALLRPLLALGMLIGVVVFRGWAAKLVFLALPVASIGALLPPFLTNSDQADLRIYSKNLHQINTDTDDIVRDILAANVDAVFLQELSVRNDGILDALRPQFPHQQFCRFNGWSGIAVLSKEEILDEGHCSATRALAAAKIRVDGRPVWLVSVHLPWPWPVPTAQNDSDAGSLLTSLDAPAVIAGDFNTMPWTYRLRRIATLTETRLAGPVRATFTRLPLPLDFALAPRGGSVEVRDAFSSDHKGIVADLSVFQRPVPMR